VLWPTIPEATVKANYERKVEPDPSRYYLKDHELRYTIKVWPELEQ
jgi:hypothetical protein